MSTCSDKVEGGALLMTFTGNSNNKVNYKSSGFYAEFIQHQDPNNFDSKVVWKQRVKIGESQLHSVGQHLGGLWLHVPPYGDQHIRTPVGCYLQIVKHKKNKENDVEAKSDHYWFTYNPSIQQRLERGKRKADPPADMMMKIHKAEQQQQQMQLQQQQQIPVQIPVVTQILSPIKEEVPQAPESQFLPADQLTPTLPIINITQPSMVYPNISVIQNVGSPSNRFQDQNSFQSPRTPMYGDTHSVQSPSSQFANISLNSPQPLSPQFSPSPQQVSQQPNNFPSQPIQQQDIYHPTQQNYNYQIPTENTFDDIPDDILAAILPDHGMNVIVADGEKKPCASESHKKSKDKHRKSSKKKDDNILKAMDKLSLEE